MRTLPLDSPEVDPRTRDSWQRHIGDPVANVGELRARLAAGSLPEAFAASARKHPQRPALTVDGHTVTHGHLDLMAGQAAASLARLGFVTGGRLALIAEVGIEEIAAYLGALRLGGTVVLANPTLTTTEMEQLSRTSAASLLVGSGPSLAAGAEVGSSDLQEIVGLRPQDRPVSTAQLSETAWEPVPVRPIDRASPAVLAFTSGTTGRPKPAPLSHSNLLASIRSVMLAWRWTKDDHLVHSLPISHQHGLSGVHATLLAGSRATLLGRFDADKTIEAIVDRGATVHFGVPAIHQRSLDRLGDRARALSALRLAISGSGPLPIDLANRYRAVTGNQLLERYGTTESGLDVSNLYDGPRIPGQIGVPLPGVELALMKDGGDIAKDGEDGEILIRGPHVFGGYLDMPATEQPLIAGWFRTGDIGTLDVDTGYLRIVGRRKDVIISGGMNVYPREVEGVIRAFPGVGDVVVVGIPSKRWGEEVVAVVSPGTLDVDDLSTFVTERLAAYKRPKRTVITEVVPRNAVGKVVSSNLMRLISAGGSKMPPGGIGSTTAT